MAATVVINGITATISDYKWSCADQKMKLALDEMLSPLGPSGADPNPDYTAAAAAVRKFGGKLVNFDKSKFDPNVIY